MRFWHRLRVNLQPYLWMTAQDCVLHSKAMMRPLVYDWPCDPLAVGTEDEFLLGESLLVAPLLQEDAENRAVYLPQGQWVGLFDHIQYEGRQLITAGSKYRLPVFLRCGSGLPLNLASDLTLGGKPEPGAEKYDHLHFLLAGQRGKQVFHDDCGNSFTITWENRHPSVLGQATCKISWEIV